MRIYSCVYIFILFLHGQAVESLFELCLSFPEALVFWEGLEHEAVDCERMLQQGFFCDFFSRIATPTWSSTSSLPLSLSHFFALLLTFPSVSLALSLSLALLPGSLRAGVEAPVRSSPSRRLVRRGANFRPADLQASCASAPAVRHAR